MKSFFCALLALSALLFTIVPILGQEMAADLRGTWTLNVAKSNFGDGPKPKGGFVNWTKEGWVFALLLPDGSLYADAVVTEHGCMLVGVEGQSCEFEVITPKHVRITLKKGSAVRRVGDIELLDKNTTKATHHVINRDGTVSVESTVWDRQTE